jgi:hypothetical protein
MKRKKIGKQTYNNRKQRKENYADLSARAAERGLTVDLSGFKEDGQYKKKNEALKAALNPNQVATTGEVPLSEPMDGASGSQPITAGSQADAVTETIGTLTPALGMDVAGGLGFRNDIRNILGGEIAAGDAEGLSTQDYADINAVSDQRFRDATGDFKNRVQSVMGDLKGRGFSSSNLAGRAMQSGAYDPFSRNIQDIAAGESQMRQGILNARAGRKGQRISSALGAATTLGSSNLNALQGAYINPSSYGGLTEAQAASMMSNMASTGANYYADQARYGAATASQPRMIQY